MKSDQRDLSVFNIALKPQLLYGLPEKVTRVYVQASETRLVAWKGETTNEKKKKQVTLAQIFGFVEKRIDSESKAIEDVLRFFKLDPNGCETMVNINQLIMFKVPHISTTRISKKL